MNHTDKAVRPFSVMPLAARVDLQEAAALAQHGVWKPPYPWDVPPPGRNGIWKMGSMVVPVAGYGMQFQVEILNYTVQPGMYFALKAVMFRYDGDSFVQGSGDVVGSIDVNNPQAFNQTNLTTAARVVADFGQIIFNIGSFDHGPIPVPSSLVFKENDRIGMKAYANANVALGPPNRFNGMIVGWEWPMT